MTTALAPAPAPSSPPTPSGEISTFGWDTAFAVRIANVNAAIAARKMSPTGFSYTSPTDPKVTCQGSFGDWQLVRGGDGGAVNVMLPVTDVTGVAPDGDSYSNYTWSKGSLTFTIRLAFFETSTGSTTRQLQVQPVGAGPSTPVVEYYAADESILPSPPWAIYSIQAALTAWCTANLADFAYIFSVADINDEADKGAWSFLKPSYVTYSYVDGYDDEDAFLGVLAMTSGRSPDNLQQVIDKRIVPAGVEGAFCISRALMLTDLVVPQWPRSATAHGLPTRRASPPPACWTRRWAGSAAKRSMVAVNKRCTWP